VGHSSHSLSVCHGQCSVLHLHPLFASSDALITRNSAASALHLWWITDCYNQNAPLQRSSHRYSAWSKTRSVDNYFNPFPISFILLRLSIESYCAQKLVVQNVPVRALAVFHNPLNSIQHQDRSAFLPRTRSHLRVSRPTGCAIRLCGVGQSNAKSGRY
jgi:hypothetical protein